MGLGSILGGIGSIVAAPFTGGTSLAWLPAAIGAGGAVADSLAAGRAQGRGAAAQANTQQQQQLLQALLAQEQANQNRANLDLNQRNFQLTAPNKRGSTAVLGDLLSRAQDVKITPRAGLEKYVPQVTGGFKPSNLSPETRQLGQSMTQNALTQQLKGDSFTNPPVQDFSQAKPLPLPQANGLDKFLSIAGPIAGIAGAVGQSQQDASNAAWLRQLLQGAQPTTASQLARPLPMPQNWQPQQGQLLNYTPAGGY